jgi:hypothetical protein
MPGLSEFSAGFGLDEVTTKSGRRKAEAEEQQLDIGELQLAIAKELYGKSTGLRDQGVNQLQYFMDFNTIPGPVDVKRPDLAGLDTFLQTGDLPTAVTPAPLPSVPNLVAGERDVLEAQFDVARDNLIAQAPTQGGRLAQSLAALEAQRALGVTQLEGRRRGLQYEQDLGEAERQNALASRLYGVGLDVNREQANVENQLRRALFSTAVGTGFGQQNTALGGLSSASGTFGNVASLALSESLEKQKRAQDKAGTYAGFGAGAMGRKGGGGSTTAAVQSVPFQNAGGFGSQAAWF